MPNREEEEKRASMETPVQPDYEDINLSEAQADFLIGASPKMNWLINAAFAAADAGDIELFAGALAMLAAFNFVLGTKFEQSQGE